MKVIGLGCASNLILALIILRVPVQFNNFGLLLLTTFN